MPGTDLDTVLSTYNARVRPAFDGKQAVVFFPNGYGVSVISHFGSYGVEAAILTGTFEKYNLCYTTPLTDDVIGGLTPDTLKTLLQQVAAL